MRGVHVKIQLCLDAQGAQLIRVARLRRAEYLQRGDEMTSCLVALSALYCELRWLSLRLLLRRGSKRGWPTLRPNDATPLNRGRALL
jgi:hypothetical protein